MLENFVLVSNQRDLSLILFYGEVIQSYYNN